MIYSSNKFCHNYKYLDETTFIVNIMKNIVIHIILIIIDIYIIKDFMILILINIF